MRAAHIRGSLAGAREPFRLYRQYGLKPSTNVLRAQLLLPPLTIHLPSL